MDHPFVSFLCPTFGRMPHELHLLEEKVYWFSRQDYPPDRRELIILNDSSAQILTCDFPGVRVVNEGRRFPTLGCKMNALISLAKGEILIPDEDDDVSLPNRAFQATEWLSNGVTFFDPGARWYQEGGETGRIVYDNKNCCHHASCYRRGVLYYPSVSGNQDQEVSRQMHNKALSDSSIVFKSGVPPEESSYVYRWGVSQYHLSAQSTTTGWADANPGQKITCQIRPKMRMDYTVMIQAEITKMRMSLFRHDG